MRYYIPLGGINIKSFTVAVVILILIGITGVFLSGKVFSSGSVHYHAGFVVFEHNKKLDFSDSKYMYIKPCSVNGSKESGSVDTQLEKAHLHDNVGDLVHVEEHGATWQDLFTNIGYPLNYTRTTGYVNTHKVVDFQKQPIRPYDSLVVFIGENDQKLITQGVSKEYIVQQSKKSIDCGD